MDHFAAISSSERRSVFMEAAARMGISALVVEKDFWASWCLKRVFQMNDIPGHIFKGGTSLSKVYRVIDRFSEDIDISIDRSGLGFSGDKDPAAPELTNKRRQRLRDELKSTCSAFVKTEVLPRFQRACTTLLGAEGWTASMDPRDQDQQSVVFNYPHSLTEYVAGAYLTPSVLLEFGCRGDQWPAKDSVVRAFAAENFPNLFGDADVPVRVLAAERTFWEKVTLIHSENHRPESSTPRERLSRHYSDVARMYSTELGKRAAVDKKLLEDVVNHKRMFFPSGWAHYDTAKPGTLRLMPNEQLEKYLRADYQRMREMFFGEPQSFDVTLNIIGSLESELNRHGISNAVAPAASGIKSD